MNVSDATAGNHEESLSSPAAEKLGRLVRVLSTPDLTTLDHAPFTYRRHSQVLDFIASFNLI
jgi:hypothetical protein